MNGMDYHECGPCNGTGIDETQWDERCVYCRGMGDVPDGDAFDDDLGLDEACDDEDV